MTEPDSRASPSQKTLFLQAVEKYNKQLVDPAARKDRDFWQHATLEDALEEVKSAEQKSALTGHTRRLFQRVQPALNTINHYGHVLDVMVQANPNPSALIWGGLRLVIRVASNYVHQFEEFVQMIQAIGDAFPRFQDYERLFSADRLNASLLAAYGSVLDFLMLANKTFSTSGFKTLIKSMWRPLNDKLRHVVESLKRQTELADIEFQILAVQKAEEERLAQAAERIKQEKERLLVAEERQRQEAERFQAKSMRDLEAERLARERQEREEVERSGVMTWLSRWDTDANYFNARMRHADNPSSCSWIFETTDYKSWFASKDPCSRLWLNSGPGTGKTVLAGHVVHTLQEQLQGHNSILAYFFCSSRDGMKNDPLGPLRSLLCQMLDALPSIPDPILLEYKEQIRKGLELPCVLHPSRLQEILQHTLAHFEDAYLVVDGLDECDDREHVLASLSAISGTLSGARTHVLVTSRAEPDISRSFSSFNNVKIHPSDTKSDIRCYIIACIKTIPDLDDTEERFAVKELSKKVSGMFIWVRLVIEMLRDSATRQEFHEALMTIPRGLHQIYCLVIERIHKKIMNSPRSRQELARGIFRWLALAARPVRLPELCESLAVEIAQAAACNQMNSWKDKLKAYQPSSSAILNICGPLVDLEDDTIKLLHHTAKDFLTGKSGHLARSQTVMEYQVDHVTGNQDITATCLSYLTNIGTVHECLSPVYARQWGTKGQFKTWVSRSRTSIRIDIRRDFPFYEYACRHWTLHLGRCPPESSAPLVASFVAFRRSREMFLWCAAWSLFHARGRVPQSRHFRRLRKHGKELVSWLAFVDQTFRELRDVDDVNLWCVTMSWLEMFRLLLARGVMLAEEEEAPNVLLKKAQKQAGDAVLRTLLNIGGDVMAGIESERIAVQYALQNSDFKVIELFLEAGTKHVDPSQLEIVKRSQMAYDQALQRSKSEARRATTFQQHEFLGKYFGLSQRFQQITFLLIIKQRDHAVLRYLIDLGAVPNGLLIFTAVSCGDIEAVRLLLEQCWDSEQGDECGRVALCWLLNLHRNATPPISWVEKSLWLLVRYGRPLGHEHRPGRTIFLLMAVACQHHQIIQLLLEIGIHPSGLLPSDPQRLLEGFDTKSANHYANAVYLHSLLRANQTNDKSWMFEELANNWPFKSSLCSDAEAFSLLVGDVLREYAVDCVLLRVFTKPWTVDNHHKWALDLIVSWAKKDSFAKAVIAWGVLYGTIINEGDNVEPTLEPCPVGFDWQEVEAGYQCEGGSHFLFVPRLNQDIFQVIDSDENDE